MKDRKSTIAAAAAALLFGTLGAGQLSAECNDLGSGAEVRENLLQSEMAEESLAACKDGKCSMPPKQSRKKRWGRSWDEDGDEDGDEEEGKGKGDKTGEGGCGKGTCGS